MTPDMSVEEIAESFIFIVQRRRIIEWRAFDWEQARLLDPKLFSHLVHSLPDLKSYFARRIFTERVHEYGRKYKTVRHDCIEDWMKRPDRITAATLSDAVALAIELRAKHLYRDGDLLIDIAAIERHSRERRQQAEADERRRKILENAPDWVRRYQLATNEQDAAL